MELFNAIFTSFWTWAGSLVLLAVIVSPLVAWANAFGNRRITLRDGR